MDPLAASAIKADDLVASYGKRVVIHGVSLSVTRGEMLGLIGPNGSGKSTLLRLLSGYMRPISGSIEIDGVSQRSLKPREIALRLAFVPQTEPVLFDFTVKEVVLMGRSPYIRGLGRESENDFKATLHAMAAADILDLADRTVTTLSGGEHRRVLIARALAQDTPIILLDEPTAHLDITHQVEVLALARRMVEREGRTVIVALHELNLAAEYCDRLLLLSGGHAVAVGGQEQVLREDLLERAYGAPIRVGRSPATGRPMVYPVARPIGHASSDELRPTGPSVHVICGGATGATALSQLVRRGFQVSAGVVNQLDSDQRTAEALGIDHAVEAPFSRIGDEALRVCAGLVERAKFVLVTDVPFGMGNLANLELAVDAAKNGKVVFLLDSEPFASRDFTGGVAARLWERAVELGATRVHDLQAALDSISEVEAKKAVSAHGN